MKREKKRWENEELLHINRRETHTDFKRPEEQSYVVSLNGNWKFLYLGAPEYSPEGFSAKSGIVEAGRRKTSWPILRAM